MRPFTRILLPAISCSQCFAGSGTVYRATWRGETLAVKVLKLPEEPKTENEATREALKSKVQEISSDFTKEVEICCDLTHPNLVGLLGYATEPGLYMMQELMEGSSIDQQLYVERWKPTQAQVLKVATDVARGMAYLHTMFQEPRGSNSRARLIDRPVIHRDLKSPNLLFWKNPPPRGQEGDARDLVTKISDFGLSRDKSLEADSVAQTALMTGCGSVLWMAPEILQGEKYNEKVDVFSYAMCLVELVHRNLPWHGSGIGQQVIPVRLTQGKRPTHQLNKTDPTLKQLIVECWDQNPSNRPEFPEIVQRLQAMRDERGPTRKSTLAHDSIVEEDEDEDEEQGYSRRQPEPEPEVGSYSRAVSPSRGGGAE